MKIPEDPLIQELLPEFVETWLNDIDEQFNTIIESKNADDLYRMAHTLKGSCFQFGLDEIANMGIELMGYAKEKNWMKAKSMKAPIRNSFVDVQNFLNKGS